jgi:hypothetical protein
MKRRPRTTRWLSASERAVTALDDLVLLQKEFADWLAAMPEHLESSELADKLRPIVALDLARAFAIAEEAEIAPLPRLAGLSKEV